MIVVTVQVFLFQGYSGSAIGDWWKIGFVVFIDLLIKKVHLPFSNSMSLIFNAFTVLPLCPDDKHNKKTKGKSYSKLLR